MGDTNGDGVLDDKELANLLGVAGFDFDEDCVAELIRQCDVNGDQLIDYGEFVPMMTQYLEEMREEEARKPKVRALPPTNPMLAELQQLEAQNRHLQWIKSDATQKRLSLQAEKVPNAIGSVNADLVGQTKALTSQLVKASEEKKKVETKLEGAEAQIEELLKLLKNKPAPVESQVRTVSTQIARFVDKPAGYNSWPEWKKRKWDWQHTKNQKDKGELYHYDKYHPDESFLPQTLSARPSLKGTFQRPGFYPNA